MDERKRFHSLVHGDRVRDSLVAHRVQHGVSGAVGDVTSAPFLSAAEVTLSQQAVRLIALGNRNLLSIDDDLAVTLLYTAPGHAPRGELANRLGRGIDEHADDLLVGTPVTAAHRVLEMHVLVVARRLDNVAEARLHAALGSGRMRTLRWHQRQDDDVVTSSPGADTDSKPREPAADHQNVGVDHIHALRPRTTLSNASDVDCDCEGTYGSP